MAGITPDQVERIQYTLKHAHLIPGEAGKEDTPAGQGRYACGTLRRAAAPLRGQAGTVN